MPLLFKVVWLLLLLVIVYQDYRYRAVSWILFPTLASAFTGFNLLQMPFAIFWQNLLFNCSFVLIQLGILFVYFSLKEKRFVDISAGYLGLGDILFFLSVCCLFSPFFYVAFYLASLVFTIILVLISRLFHSNTYNKIPLAGLQANLLAIGVVVDWACNCFIFTNDTWIYTHLIQWKI